eukprot:6561185-Prymnesium_polylepis.1
MEPVDDDGELPGEATRVPLAETLQPVVIYERYEPGAYATRLWEAAVGLAEFIASSLVLEGSVLEGDERNDRTRALRQASTAHLSVAYTLRLDRQESAWSSSAPAPACAPWPSSRRRQRQR